MSLIELVTTMSIVGIITAIAVPNYNKMQSDARLDAEVTKTISTIRAFQVKSMTMKRESKITIVNGEFVATAYNADGLTETALMSLRAVGQPVKSTDLPPPDPLNPTTELGPITESFKITFPVSGITTYIVDPRGYITPDPVPEDGIQPTIIIKDKIITVYPTMVRRS